MALQPHTKVPAPAIVPSRYGLYAAATVLDEPHGMWEYGTVWDDSNNCSHGGLWQPCCSEFAGTPSVATRPVTVTVTVTATPAQGGGADITLSATDDWTGPNITGSVTVGALAPAAVSTDGVAVDAGVIGACDSTAAVNVTFAGNPGGVATGDLVIGADCTGTLVLAITTEQFEPIDNKAFSLSTFVYSDPFVVYDGRTCPDQTEAQVADSARARLALTEQRQVEQQLWKGPTRPHFASNPEVTVLGGGTAVSPAMGIALIEGWLADNYLGVGYIHTPRYTAGLFNREMQISYDLSTGPTLATSLGTRYVFGSGYATTGPDGSTPPAGSAWAYVTGQIVVRRSPLVTNATRDRLTGCVTGLAERTVVVGIQCGGIAGVLIDYARCDCPTPTP